MRRLRRPAGYSQKAGQELPYQELPYQELSDQELPNQDMIATGATIVAVVLRTAGGGAASWAGVSTTGKSARPNSITTEAILRIASTVRLGPAGVHGPTASFPLFNPSGSGR